MPTYVMGDVHGQYDQLTKLLSQQGLLSSEGDWAGGEDSLYFLGDFLDRGPKGLEVIDLIMHLEEDAPRSGGKAAALLGNHDVMFLAAERIGNATPPGADIPLRLLWQQNGGRKRELDSVSDAQRTWLSSLPAMIQLGEWHLQHADSTFYADYGRTIADINTAFTRVLQSNSYEQWAELIVAFIRRGEFMETRGGSAAAAQNYLTLFGATHLVHGHTPIPVAAPHTKGQPVTAPLVYNDGLCINIDGGMYLGEPGFLFEIPATVIPA